MDPQDHFSMQASTFYPFSDTNHMGINVISNAVEH
jgi:hypothetical protein